MRNITLDTDIGYDCDDAVAVALACQLPLSKRINLVEYVLLARARVLVVPFKLF